MGMKIETWKFYIKRNWPQSIRIKVNRHDYTIDSLWQWHLIIIYNRSHGWLLGLGTHGNDVPGPVSLCGILLGFLTCLGWLSQHTVRQSQFNNLDDETLRSNFGWKFLSSKVWKIFLLSNLWDFIQNDTRFRGPKTFCYYFLGRPYAK